VVKTEILGLLILKSQISGDILFQISRKNDKNFFEFSVMPQFSASHFLHSFHLIKFFLFPMFSFVNIFCDGVFRSNFIRQAFIVEIFPKKTTKTKMSHSIFENPTQNFTLSPRYLAGARISTTPASSCTRRRFALSQSKFSLFTLPFVCIASQKQRNPRDRSLSGKFTISLKFVRNLSIQSVLKINFCRQVKEEKKRKFKKKSKKNLL
jgi:hypothetical protein